MKILKRSMAFCMAVIMLFTMFLSACKNNEDADAKPEETTTKTEEDPTMPIMPIGFAQVYETTGTKSSLLQQKTSATVTEFEGEESNRQTIYVDPSKQYQSYIGYGASLTHASAYLLMQADEATRNEILHALFSRDGANLSVVRIPVGASDYVPGNTYFTCDDMPKGKTDVNLENFNLDHDEDIIAVAQEIIQINPNVIFMASPWSAPAWMKTNDKLVGAASLRSDMYEVYANYLVKFVTEYQKHGIDITMLTLVNEPSVGTLSYPTMNMNGEEAAIITAYLGTKFAALELSVDIVAWDYNYGSSYASRADEYLDTIYNEYAETAGKYSNTVAFHGYDGDAYWNSSRKFGMKNGIQKVSQEYGRASIITEITESDVSFDFANNLMWACQNIVIAPCAVQNDGEGNFWNGCGGALYWNLVLDSNGQPCPADHGACFGVISLDSQTQEDGGTTYRYTKSSAYYAMAQVSKFLYAVDGVDCYAINATSTASNLTTLAYYRNDGSVIVVVCNPSTYKSAKVDVVIDNRKISYEIAPQSMVTFIDNKESQTQYTTYNFSNVEMRELLDGNYHFTFGVDCGNDDVQVYFTDRDFIANTEVCKTVTKEVVNQEVRFSFVAEVERGIDYYLWVVGEDKETVLPISAPYMEPYLDATNSVLASVRFGFFENVSHISFCDREGKAVYESTSADFDAGIVSIITNLPISSPSCIIPSHRFKPEKYYFVVLTAKNGLLKIISKPLTAANND